jgi:hypothetical protein
MNTELTLEQARLAARVAATLTKAAEERVEDDWDNQIDLILTHAQQRQHHRRRQFSAGIAVAASVVFMVALPTGWLLKTNKPTSTSSYPMVEAQLLEEMDWILAMEDAARAHK